MVALALAVPARAAKGVSPTNYTGTVVDDQDQPVVGASVDCYQYQSPAGFGYRDREPEIAHLTVTDGKGAFTFSPAPGCATLVVVKKPGLATAWKTWSPTLTNSTDPIVLSAPTVLAGLVMDEDHQPVAGAEVWVTDAVIVDAYGRDTQENELFGEPARTTFSATTGPDGRFRIANFPAGGQVGLAVHKAGKAQHPIGQPAGSRAEHSGDESIELLVGPAGSVEGKVVVVETGQPLGGVKIKLEPSEAGLFGSEFREPVKSAANGTFRIPDVQPGKYYLSAFIPGGPVPDWVVVQENNQVTVVAGETVHDTMVHVTEGAVVAVTVVTTNDLNPVPNVAVSSGGLTTYTGANGVALLRAPVGKAWFTSRNDWRSENTTADIKANQINPVQIVLVPPPKITGVVRDANGAPAPGVRVSFHPGQYPAAPDFTEVTTDKNGRYEITLKLSREAMGWNGPISPTNFILARDFSRNLAALQEFEKLPTNLDLDLQPGITLSGSVKDPAGTPVAIATVALSILSGHSITPLEPQPAKVDAQGSFLFPAMPQGREYYFFQGITAKGYGTTGGQLKAQDTKTNHYEFPTFVLKRANLKLAGQVLGLEGNPVDGVTVSLSGAGQLQWQRARSGAQGHFSFDQICEGDVTVSVNANNTQGNAPAHGGDTNVVVRLGVNLVSYGQNASPPRKIAGAVRDPSGAPSPGATMTLFPVQGRAIDSPTDSSGRYEFKWQPQRSGDLTTWLLARDLKHGLAAIQQVDDKMTNLDLTLQPGLAISTQVQDSTGQSVTNATARVTVWAEERRGFSLNPEPMTREADGHFRLNALPQGLRYTLRVEAPGYSFASLTADAEDTKTSFLALPPSIIGPTNHVIAGVVLGLDGTPAPNIPVEIFGRDQPIPRNSLTDAQGHFSFGGNGLGPMVLYAGGRSGPATSARGDQTNLVIRMGAAPPNRSAASVAVTTSGTVFDASGAPAAGVFVTAFPSFGQSNSIQTDTGGKYIVHRQTLGTRPNGQSSKYWLFGRDPQHNLAATAELEAAATTLDLHLQPALTLTGAVQDAVGNALANASVQIVLLPLERASGGLALSPTNADGQGLFSVGALAQGAGYLVNVASPGYGSNSVTVAGANTQANLFKLPPIALKPANRQLAGQVISEDGKPVWGAQVTVRGEGQPAPRPGRTDANGNFVIKNICEGPVEVRAVLPAGVNQGRTGVGVIQAHGGDTNAIVKLGMQNGIPTVFPVDQGPGPVSRAPDSPLKP